jgi:phospholipase C
MDRRKFLRASAGAAAAGAAFNMLPPLIQKALAVNANNLTKSIKDVEHIVILMQENRSFDHYFGTMKGVRGFGDRFPIPLEGGTRVFFQSDGKRVIPPYRADKKTVNAALIHGTPHDFPDTQAAWNQGKYGFWPKFKTPNSMAYYTREEIPFQYALAESFTISDAYHCSVATGTDPNRIMFWSGSNFNPEKRAAGVNCTDADSEPSNLRCWPELADGTGKPGHMPEPGYKYQGSSFKWDTIPDVLEKAGISWRIYQDPNDNWAGAMHGCLAFESFRTAKPGSPIYENGMRHWSLDDLTKHVKEKTLPQVSWILPSQSSSEHPSGPSSPLRGGDFTHQVLTAITSNPEVWSKTVFFLTFDENDGLFDHLPAPAVPSYNADGTLAGKSTIDLAGMYFNNERGTEKFPDPFYAGSNKSGKDKLRFYQDKRDMITGNLRPWGMGPRVPMYIISPWSKGGWVDSQVTDHTSVGQFIEKRFSVTVPAISPWHRSVSGDLTSAFDFVNPNDPVFSKLPETANFAEVEEQSKKLPGAVAPEVASTLYQERGTRFSRALPYELHTNAEVISGEKIRLHFENTGAAGAIFHVYDLLHLDKIPRRYTVESGKKLEDDWNLIEDQGIYLLEVYGPNGYFRYFAGNAASPAPEIKVIYDTKNGGVTLQVNGDKFQGALTITDNAYRTDGPWLIKPGSGKSSSQYWNLDQSSNWYDFTVISSESRFERRFAGRVETGKDGVSDPAMAATISHEVYKPSSR